ncbi:MAG: slipin family protein [Pseudomonadales bacterium]
MWPIKTVRIANNERAIWMRDGNFMSVLTPGHYRFFRRVRHTVVNRYAPSEVVIKEPELRSLLQTHGHALAPHATIVELAEQEVGLLRVNGIARQLLWPGTVYAFWNHVQAVDVERATYTADLAVPQAWLRAIRQAGERMDLASLHLLVQSVQVDKGFEAILMVDGAVERTLSPGRYAFWRAGRDLEVTMVDKRLQTLEVNGQEILTRDRVSLRINAALQFTVADATRAMVDVPRVQDAAYRAVQFALRGAVGGLTLDQLLADKSTLAGQVQTDVAARIAELGLQAQAVGIKDVILPGEMKTILNQVVEAEKRAEANAVRRRDESANVRSLANTARMLEGNAMMARLKELETLETISAQVETLQVMNGLDGVLKELVTLRGD